jgi:hypothetical protein
MVEGVEEGDAGGPVAEEPRHRCGEGQGESRVGERMAPAAVHEKRAQQGVPAPLGQRLGREGHDLHHPFEGEARLERIGAQDQRHQGDSGAGRIEDRLARGMSLRRRPIGLAAARVVGGVLKEAGGHRSPI